jgi:uncharacterized protein
MDAKTTPETLLSFPCDHTFKAFGPDGEEFVRSVKQAVSIVIPVPLDAVRLRSSAKGSYVCVSVVVRLHNADQLRMIYGALQKIRNLKYLL